MIFAHQAARFAVRLHALRAAALFTFVCALLPALGWAAPPVATAPKPETEAFYGVYLRDSKIGSFTVKRDDAADYQGKPASRMETAMTLDLRILGAPNRTTSSSVSWSDPKSGKPLAQTSRTESAGRVTDVSATFTDRSVSFVADIQGTKQNGTLTLKDGEEFLFDTSGGAVFEPKVGMKLKGKTFVPDLLQLVDGETEIVAKETITVNGQAVSAFKVTDKSSMASTTLWLNEAGDILLVNAPLGMTIKKMSKDLALAAPDANAPSPDFAVAAAIKPSGVAIAKPRTSRTIRYAISGVTRNLPPGDTIQSVTYRNAPAATAQADDEKNARIATVTVTTRPLPTGPAAKLFKKASDAPANLQPFLKSTAYVPAGDADFIAIARDVIGNETDTAKAARKLAVYAHNAIKPDPSIAALRTARDIKTDPRGVCRDYTTFYATLARAVGLPTKQCVGIAYANGMFLYHAWPEVWVGNDTWIALEPTWGAPFADATHIKLAEGEITDLYNIAADMGRYRVEVLDVK